ncbi:MAG: adventurous gliding motility protein CglE [Myxococcota bacterium]
MKTLSFLLALAVAAPMAMLTATTAHAQDDDEVLDLDSDGGKNKKKKKKAEAVVSSDEIVREIERGWYVKANAGMATYLLTYGPAPGGGGNVIRPGSVVSLAFGQDFVDEPNRSMAFDVQFYQGVHNGMQFDRQRELGVTDHVQGDVRTFALMASYEFSTYPSRRVGIGFRAGGGIMMIPLLMPRSLYETEVVREWGASPTIHSSPHFPVFAGPTIEYYTKLSHFSVGIDVDGMFVIGMNDLGINATGFMKYTF